MFNKHTGKIKLGFDIFMDGFGVGDISLWGQTSAGEIILFPMVHSKPREWLKNSSPKKDCNFPK